MKTYDFSREALRRKAGEALISDIMMESYRLAKQLAQAEARKSDIPVIAKEYGLAG